MLWRQQAIKEEDLRPLDLVIKEITDDFQLHDFFVVYQ